MLQTAHWSSGIWLGCGFDFVAERVETTAEIVVDLEVASVVFVGYGLEELIAGLDDGRECITFGSNGGKLFLHVYCKRAKVSSQNIPLGGDGGKLAFKLSG